MTKKINNSGATSMTETKPKKRGRPKKVESKEDRFERELREELAAMDAPAEPTVLLTYTLNEFTAIIEMMGFIVKSYSNKVTQETAAGNAADAQKWMLVARGYELLLAKTAQMGQTGSAEERTLH